MSASQVYGASSATHSDLQGPPSTAPPSTTLSSAPGKTVTQTSLLTFASPRTIDVSATACSDGAAPPSKRSVHESAQQVVVNPAIAYAQRMGASTVHTLPQSPTPPLVSAASLSSQGTMTGSSMQISLVPPSAAEPKGPISTAPSPATWIGAATRQDTRQVKDTPPAGWVGGVPREPQQNGRADERAVRAGGAGPPCANVESVPEMSPEVLARIEANRQLALEKRRKAQLAAAAGHPTPPALVLGQSASHHPTGVGPRAHDSVYGKASHVAPPQYPGAYPHISQHPPSSTATTGHVFRTGGGSTVAVSDDDIKRAVGRIEPRHPNGAVAGGGTCQGGALSTVQSSAAPGLRDSVVGAPMDAISSRVAVVSTATVPAPFAKYQDSRGATAPRKIQRSID